MHHRKGAKEKNRKEKKSLPISPHRRGENLEDEREDCIYQVYKYFIGIDVAVGTIRSKYVVSTGDACM